MSTQSNYIETCTVAGPNGQPCEADPASDHHYGHDLSGRLVTWTTYADQRSEDLQTRIAAVMKRTARNGEDQ